MSKSVEARADAGQHALALVKILDGVDRLFDQFLDLVCLALDAGFADPQNVAFHLVQQPVHLALVFINPSDHLRTRLDHFAENEFLQHDVQIVTQVGGGRHGVRQ